jgi:hypothetical protein
MRKPHDKRRLEALEALYAPAPEDEVGQPWHRVLVAPAAPRASAPKDRPTAAENSPRRVPSSRGAIAPSPAPPDFSAMSWRRLHAYGKRVLSLATRRALESEINRRVRAQHEPPPRVDRAELRARLLAEAQHDEPRLSATAYLERAARRIRNES